MRVVAVVVSWNQADQLPACLDALDAQTHHDLQVVVVDNASADGSAEVVVAAAARSRRHPLTLVRNRTNRGFAGGVHDGLDASASAAEAEAVWLVNVDAVPAPDHLAVLVSALAADERCAAVQGMLVRTHPGLDGRAVVDSTGVEATRARLFRDRDQGRAVAEVTRDAGEVFGVTAACALYRRTALDDVAWRRADGPPRPLTEALFAYFEDVELAWRLQRLGWRCRYEPTAVATHERGGAGPRRTAFVEELNWANRLLVVRTCDVRLGRDTLLVIVTTLLKTAELALTVPRALGPALRRLATGWPGAGWRRRQLDARATVPGETVVARWFGPFSWRQWVSTWWRRIRGRAPGVAPRSR